MTMDSDGSHVIIGTKDEVARLLAELRSKERKVIAKALAAAERE